MTISALRIGAAAGLLASLVQAPAAAAADADKSCRRYLPSVGRVVEVDCEQSPPAHAAPQKPAPDERLRAAKLSLRARLGRLPGDDPVARASLGVRISNLVPSLKRIIEPAHAKVFTNGVVAASPAERAGIRPGDLILSIDGREPGDSYGLTRIIQDEAPGSEVVIEVARVGKGGADLVRGLRERADAGSVDAMIALGSILQAGLDGLQDEAEAARWLRKAADGGNAEAMAGLGVLYESGRGVAKDEAEAVRWYRAGADAGSPAAMKSLGVMYANGLGVAKDEAEAVRWYRAGSDAGSIEATSALAAMYEGGYGVARDPETAAELMFKALQAGDEFAHHQMTANADAWRKDFRADLQRRLKEAGVYEGPSDGTFGPDVLQALEALKQRGRAH